MDGILLRHEAGNDGGRVQVSDVVVFAAPSAKLGRRVSFSVLVERELNGQRVVVERHPTSDLISLDVPTANFDAMNWRA